MNDAPTWRDIYDEAELSHQLSEEATTQARKGNYELASLLNAASDAIEELADEEDRT